MDERFLPIFELTRGRIVESIHYGAIAMVDSNKKLLYSYGDPQTVAFLRSSAKPFQALPFFERNGPAAFGLTQKEQALICASHEGSDEHVRVAQSIQAKAGIAESDLQCGVHMPGDATAYKALIARGETPTTNRNNCSGKHSGMLAHAKMRGLPLDTYLDINHPIQQDILTAFAEMCDYPREKVELGVDGCSAPNFAAPLYNSALAFAWLCDPQNVSKTRAKASNEITSAMMTHPEMISGPSEFDCRLMQVGKGKIICKRGAEGFQAIGLLPGALGAASPGIGITFKVSDGDLLFRTLKIEPLNRVRPAVTLEILRQIGALNDSQMKELAEFGPTLPIKNHRGIVVGESRTAFK
ncbi:MAG: asparaginase [Chloroflexi bacterium]|nr:asparaginase [Chloroflexota bacterium]MBI3340275.1 asparaginase [Chloroflexota bacterium]